MFPLNRFNRGRSGWLVGWLFGLPQAASALVACEPHVASHSMDHLQFLDDAGDFLLPPQSFNTDRNEDDRNSFDASMVVDCVLSKLGGTKFLNLMVTSLSTKVLKDVR